VDAVAKAGGSVVIAEPRRVAIRDVERQRDVLSRAALPQSDELARSITSSSDGLGSLGEVVVVEREDVCVAGLSRVEACAPGTARCWHRRGLPRPPELAVRRQRQAAPPGGHCRACGHAHGTQVEEARRRMGDGSGELFDETSSGPKLRGDFVAANLVRIELLLQVGGESSLVSFSALLSSLLTPLAVVAAPSTPGSVKENADTPVTKIAPSAKSPTIACLTAFGSSEALARTMALALRAPDLQAVGANLTDPNAGLDEDRHSMTEAATMAALEPATAMVVEDAILCLVPTTGRVPVEACLL
jgi:hypothetical protein